MADTAHTHTAQDSAASRQIRVFLSSTFRDFMEERDLLVKQVFPSLRRRAQERGVEVVDVDLRWGVTQEESEQGKVIGICLEEIERCRPYFIGMLGERYGWTPGKTDYPDELFERKQLGWIRDHQGNASVTELEILHGVLNDPKMAGRAFFYFRDPAWSQAQREAGFVCDTPEEEAKLDALKARILTSDFPVKQGLPDPQAIADQIEADLWALIEEQYPDLDQADALEREARKHASYRQSRLGVYLGQEYVDQLEALVSGGEQKLLITGESGSGKSALIANWIHQHEQKHPGDVVYAHHLGCSNDASAIRPLLGRMLDTASKLLKEAELITEPIQVPSDWWELTAKVAETLQDLGRWCRKTGKRWIWVLDGLDRLADDDQQALPWLPLLISEGVSVVISSLDCPARAIVQERQFQMVEIGPLRRNEQEQLIDSYLGRYTKKLDADRVEQILASPLAQSPLFLRVLLEELRQCGRFETLEAQIADYIRPNDDGSLAVNDLYGRVLARLERDCGAEPVQKALTALWASRAGLSETELLAITGLARLQWAPIDLALEKAFGRNRNRLVFDHDYLRLAVKVRYLPTEELQWQAHFELADWYQSKEGWDKRDSEELPWQLQKVDLLDDLRDWLLMADILAKIQWDRGSREVINYWLIVNSENEDDLDHLIEESVEAEIEERKDNPDEQIWFADRIAELLEEAGLHRDLLLRLRKLSLEVKAASATHDEASILKSLALLASAYQDMGKYAEAAELYQNCLLSQERVLGPENLETLATICNLAGAYEDMGAFEKAERLYNRDLHASERILGPNHPHVATTFANLGGLYRKMGLFDQAEAFLTASLRVSEDQLGICHPQSVTTRSNLAVLYFDKLEYKKAEAMYKQCLEQEAKALGYDHPDTLITTNNLALLYTEMGDYEQAGRHFERCLKAQERLFGFCHPDVLCIVNNLALLCNKKGDYNRSVTYFERCVDAYTQILGPRHPDTLTAAQNLGTAYRDCGHLQKAESTLRLVLAGRQAILRNGDPKIARTLRSLALTLERSQQLDQAIEVRKQEVMYNLEHLGPNAFATMRSQLGLFSCLQRLKLLGKELNQLEQIRDRLISEEPLESEGSELLEQIMDLINSIDQL